MIRYLALVATLAVVACDDESPPRYVDVCVERENRIVLMPMPNGSGGVRMTPISQSHCVKYEKQCVAGKDYVGPTSGTCLEN